VQVVSIANRTGLEGAYAVKPAFYMHFHQGHEGQSLDRIGGVPSHLPESFPSGAGASGGQLAFIAQFYCTSERLNIPGTLCIQLYQDRDVGEGGDPLPVAIRVPVGARQNTQRLGMVHPGIEVHDIVFEAKDDPDELSDDLWLSDQDRYILDSKVGGTPCYTDDELPLGHRYLLQLGEEPAGFNFADRRAIVTLGPDELLYVRLQ
jgi:hypothetical protein